MRQRRPIAEAPPIQSRDRGTSMKVARTLSICAFLLGVVTTVAALDPTHRISQYGHSSWKIQDGYFGQPASLDDADDRRIPVGGNRWRDISVRWRAVCFLDFGDRGKAAIQRLLAHAGRKGQQLVHRNGFRSAAMGKPAINQVSGWRNRRRHHSGRERPDLVYALPAWQFLR